MLEDILEPESKKFSYKEKEYEIKPMDLITTMKVLKIIPLSEAFLNPKEAIFKMLGTDFEKVVNGAIEASGMPKELIVKMLPHHFMNLLTTIFEVNKPSFLQAWGTLTAQLPKTAKESDGKELSKLSLATGTGSKI